MNRWPKHTLLPAALFCAVWGCVRDARLPDLVPVEGQVTLDGEPLANAAVSFLPVGNTAGRGAAALTDDQGIYHLQEQDGTPGVATGSYQVVISKLVKPDGTDFIGLVGRDFGVYDPSLYNNLTYDELVFKNSKKGAVIEHEGDKIAVLKNVDANDLSRDDFVEMVSFDFAVVLTEDFYGGYFY